MNRKSLLLVVFCLLVAPLLHAGETAVDSARIYYRLGYRYVDTSLRNNGAVLRNLCAKIEKSLQEETLEKVVIYSYTSPDGSNKANTALAARRADSLESWILRNTPLPAPMLEKNSGGIAWDLLRDAVSKSEMQYKAEVLRILDNTPVWVFDGNNRVVSSRKKELMDLKGGIPYRYMYEHLFPDLRSSVSVLLYISVPEPQAEETEPAAAFIRLINDIEHDIFDAVPFAGTSWEPESANENKGEYILGKSPKEDGTSLMLDAFVEAVISQKQPERVTEEAYYSSALSLLGHQALEEERVVTFPDEYKLNYLNHVHNSIL